jgi:hypothetical protein
MERCQVQVAIAKMALVTAGLPGAATDLVSLWQLCLVVANRRSIVKRFVLFG